MVKGTLELNDNGNISEKVIEECNMAIVFGIKSIDEGAELQCMLLGGDGCDKSLMLKVLADGVLRVFTKIEENPAGKMFRIAEFTTRLEENAKHTIQELMGAEDEEEAR